MKLSSNLGNDSVLVFDIQILVFEFRLFTFCDASSLMIFYEIFGKLYMNCSFTILAIDRYLYLVSSDVDVIA